MRIFNHLYIQVLFGVLIGIIFGILFPSVGIQIKQLADIFIKLIKMLLAPTIFLTLVSGITAVSDMKKVGKIGGAALFYFMITTTAALIIGLIVVNLLHPGSGMNVNSNLLDNSSLKYYVGNTTKNETLLKCFLNVIPSTFLSAFINDEILQVIFVALLFSFGLMLMEKREIILIKGIQKLSMIFFNMIRIVMYYAPIAAFAAITFTISNYGYYSLLGMTRLLIYFYLTCIIFIFFVLGTILKVYCKINLFQLLKYIRNEILIVMGTSSSEVVLPNLIDKLSKLGCNKSVVGLVIPAGYSFNLDGTAIYLTMAAVFISQATNTDMTISQQILLLLVMIVSSKGAAGVAGSGFIILASSLSSVGHVPISGIVIILGIDTFMSEGRAVTNMIGNTIATIIISIWQKSFDYEKATNILNKQ